MLIQPEGRAANSSRLEINNACLGTYNKVEKTAKCNPFMSMVFALSHFQDFANSKWLLILIKLSCHPAVVSFKNLV